jgi:hypothetical protein
MVVELGLYRDIVVHTCSFFNSLCNDDFTNFDYLSV